jgi:SAM-dependent methyltransferase
VRRGFTCPVCTQDAWEPIEEFAYERAGSGRSLLPFITRIGQRAAFIARLIWRPRPRTRIVRSSPVSAYQRLRHAVLFDAWFPGQEEVRLSTIACRSCGFACYSPRPEECDIARKYEFLKGKEPDQGGQANYGRRARRLDTVRARRVFDLCARFAGGVRLDVLDYGGGNGKLLQPFVETGHRCAIIDYNDTPIPGVLKLGNTLEESKHTGLFDVVICSHVLEHVGDPARLLSNLRTIIRPGGVLYVEVPQEIWAGIRIDADPVTHVNFFSRCSLARLLARQGYEALESAQRISHYGNAIMEVLWVVARPGTVDSTHDTKPDAPALLRPTRAYCIKKLVRLGLATLFA